MERLEGEFEQLPGNLTLDIIMTRRQDDNKRKDKRTAFFRQTGQWGSGSTGKQAIKLLKTQLKRPGQLQWCNGANRYVHT